jgi:hypothetical protein
MKEKDINYWIARCATLEQELEIAKETSKVARRFIVDIKYPECDSLEKAEEYLQELIEGDLVGEDKGRWCVNVREIK